MARTRQEIFEQVVGFNGPERAGMLERACAGDEGLRAEIEALLRAHDRTEGAGAPPTPAPAWIMPTVPGAIEATSAEGPGSRIGPYRLLQVIGEGGFGSVFLAEQESPVVRRVALKVIKLGMDTRKVIARFEAERQALAMMDHPNIAKVFDAGATDTGRPFFVMELVRGVPITEYCERGNLPLRERLELFQQVCHAIQHAHQKGIIHRDIKPSNVLVTSADAAPSPKVIDFGVAKATAGRLTEKTLFTELRQLIGTPEYMSPEQAEMSASDVDTRSDIYSLGVLLYELLTGALPFESERLRSASVHEIQRIIREEEPPRPSTRLSTLEALPSAVARSKSEPARLSRLVRGDLDWIVMKCMEKDRTRRYETANGLALDVQRYLSGEAVLAVPPSTAYQLRKFVRRNRGPVIAGTLVAAALILGVVGTSAGLLRARRAAAAALAAKAQAEQVAEFQAQMLGQVDATESGEKLMEDLRQRLDDALENEGVPATERAATAREFRAGLSRVNATDAAAAMIDRTILRPAVEAIDKQFKDQPAVDASLRQTLAGLYRRLGRYEDARVLGEQALATRRRVLGEEHPDTLASINEMGVLLVAQGMPSEAERYYREALEKRRRVLGDEDRDTLTSINNMGFVLQELGKLAEAEPLYREALATRRRVLGPHDEDTLVSVSNLGFLLEAQGKAKEAEPYYREALEESRRILGDDHPDTLISINNMGYLLQNLGRLDEAEPLLREALERSRRVHGEDHPATINSISNMGALLYVQGKPTEAERWLREALEKKRRVLGDDHPDTIAGLGNLAVSLRAQGRLAEAEVLFREQLERSRRVLGDDNPYTLAALGALGSILKNEDKLSEAEPYLRDAVERTRRLNGEDHPATLKATSNLAALLQAQGKLPAAEAQLRDTLEKLRRVKGEDHADTACARLLLGEVLRDLARYSEAEEQLLLAEPVLRSATGVPSAQRRESIEALAVLYAKWNGAEPGKGYDTKAAQWRVKLTAQ